jgi:hypothetical protein
MNSVRLYAVLLVALVLGVPLASAATVAAPKIDSGPKDPTNETGATFAFHDSSDPPDPTLTFQCQIDGGAFKVCDKSATYGSADLQPLEGPHKFGVKAVALLGTDESAVTEWPWTIDTTPPPAPLLTAKPRNPSNDRSPTFRFSDPGAGVTLQCELDSGGFTACTGEKTYTQQAAGSHIFSVRASDAAGNTSTTSYTWTIDLTPPPAPSIGSGPANPTTETGANFSFSDSDAGVTFGCQIDGGAFSSCASPAAYSGLAVTAHVFSVRATDLAGNTGAATSYGWTVVTPSKTADTTAPGEVTSLKRKVGYGVLKLTWSRPADGDFDYVRVFVAKGSKAAKAQPRTSVYKGTGTRYTNKRFENGTYYRYAIISYDKAGNASRGLPVVVQPSVLLRSPKAGVVVHAPPHLAWAKVPKATFYNVQLFFSGRKILSAWPSAAGLGLKRSWSYEGRSFRLKTGTYHWYVWPGFGPRSKSRYGKLLGQSGFTVR